MKGHRIQQPTKYALLTAVLCLAWSYPGMAFLISGQITDSANNGIPLVRVEIYDEDIGPDFLLDTVYANATGNYAKFLTNIFFENPDVYVSVDWSFAMTPAAAFNDHHMVLKSIVNGANSTLVTTFTAKESAITVDHDPANPLVKNLKMNQAQPGGGGITGLVSSINLSLSYYQNNKGSVNWEVEWDVPMHVRTGNIGSYMLESDQSITIAQVDIPPATGAGRTSDVYHEMGHLVHYRIGNNLPTGTCFFPPSASYPGHVSNSERSHSCAITEGWASYVGELTDAGAGGANDNKYLIYRDSMNVHWRGEESPATGKDTVTIARGGTYPASGVHGNDYESGEWVEGANGGTWFGIDTVGGVTAFSDNFKVMVDDDPDNLKQFIDGIASDKGANTAATRGIYGQLQTHGTVYNRARFETDTFNEDEPPDTAPGSDESYAKEIDGVMFIRGKEVTVELEEVPRTDLGVAVKHITDEVKIGYKNAVNGDGEAASTITTFTTDVNFALLDPDLELDTTAIGDGDWDLVAIGKNFDGFSDNLLPSWMGDGTAAVNTDERYLKTIGTWYDKDRDPSTNMDKEGKVAIDNTAPTIDATQFKPQ